MASTRAKRKDREDVNSLRKRAKTVEDEEKLDNHGLCSRSSKVRGLGGCSKKECVNDTKTTRQYKASSAMTAFVRSYKGLDDWHLPIFNEVAAYTKAKRVLYPGSYCHLTASLCFPSVVYVDSDCKMGRFFKDETLLKWIEDNKRYTDKTLIQFLCKNFEMETFEKVASFDLMISASAGIVSVSCEKYIKKGGYFLVSDAHSDARKAYLSGCFDLVGAFQDGVMLTANNDLERCFKTTKGTQITADQVDESIAKPRSKRSFKLEKELMFYLFCKK